MGKSHPEALWTALTSNRGNWTAKELHSGPFLACPKMYEFRFADVSNRNCLISGPYLISGWFMGSHRTREGNARRPPSLIYAGIPVVRQFVVPDMKRISFCLAQAFRFGIAGWFIDVRKMFAQDVNQCFGLVTRKSVWSSEELLLSLRCHNDGAARRVSESPAC
jgi:hypothetical protein